MELEHDHVIKVLEYIVGKCIYRYACVLCREGITINHFYTKPYLANFFPLSELLCECLYIDLPAP